MRVIKISNPILPAPPPFCDNSHNATMKRLLFTACKIAQRLIPKHHYFTLSKTQIKKKKKKSNGKNRSSNENENILPELI